MKKLSILFNENELILDNKSLIIEHGYSLINPDNYVVCQYNNKFVITKKRRGKILWDAITKNPEFKNSGEIFNIIGTFYPNGEYVDWNRSKIITETENINDIEYQRIKGEVKSEIIKLLQHLKDFDEKQKKQPTHGGFGGSLAHVREELKNINEFLK